MINTEIPPRAFERLFNIQMRLEPEALTMDGEATPSQVRMREKKLLKEWSMVERAIGRLVSQEEISEIYWEKRRNQHA